MATIANRYSFLRRQFEGKDGSEAPETPVILYQMQQFKVVPSLCYTWALLFSINRLYGMNKEYKERLEETKGQDSKVFRILSDVHVHACGMKALGSYAIETYGELLKQACGGHGYL